MNAEKMMTVILDPARHGEGVNHFLAHFALTRSRPTRETLREILARFAEIPYENLSKIIKFNRYGDDRAQRLRLPEEVMHEHAAWRLGGTCFSLTFFLQSILQHHDFVSYIVMGDMRAGRNLHCALIVMLDEVKYLVDPGYVLHRPLTLDPARPRVFHTQHTGVELRFDPPANSYDLFTFNRHDMKWRYRFADRPIPLPEFGEHWQASFHRNSMHGLCLTRVSEEELIFIHKQHMRITSLTRKRNVNLKKNYHAMIHEFFGIAPDYVEQALKALQEIMQRERETGEFILHESKHRISKSK